MQFLGKTIAHSNNPLLPRHRSQTRRLSGVSWITLILCLTSSVPISLYGQQRAVTQYQVQAWQQEHGLPGNTVAAITQTADGYIWIATEDGLARFDGVRFTNFNKQNTPRLVTNDFSALFSSRDGGLWIGTLGAGVLHYRGGTFRTHTTQEGLSNDAITSLYEDARGDLWVGTSGGGLNRLNERGIDPVVPSRGFVRALAPARAGGLWIGMETEGVVRLHQGQLLPVPVPDEVRSQSVRALLEEEDGGLWIGTRGGLFHLRNGRTRAYTVADGLSSHDIQALHRDRDGALWIGTAGGGLNRLLNGRFEALTAQDGLPNDVVSAIFEDREGNLWVGMTGGGVAVLRSGVFLPLTPREGLSSEIALPILQDRDGAIWIGTFGGGLNRWKDGEVTVYTTADGLTSDFILSLAESPDGTLWIGTRAGLNRRKDGRITAYSPGPDATISAVTSLLADRHGRLWVGTSAGLGLIERGRFVADSAYGGLPDQFISFLLEDRQGEIWIGTSGGGLHRYRQGKFDHFTTADGLASDVVTTLHEDAEGALWVGTSLGLSRLRSGRFVTLDVRHGLPDDKIHRILEDEQGNFWMSSNHGIFRVPRKEMNAVADGEASAVSSTTYSAADGMPATETNGGVQPAGWKDRTGRLWFPTMKGVAIVDPAAATRSAWPVPVLIERLLVNDREVSLASTLAELPADADRLQFDFTGLSFVAPERITFQYRLEGYDTTWIQSGTRRSAFYTNLPPGRYTFLVRARNRGGVWSESPAAEALTIAPRFYQTWPFYLAVVALFGAAVFGLDQVRLRVHRARERELLALVEERERAERRYRELFENANDLVLTTDLEGRLTSLNHQGEIMLGIPEGTLSSATLEQIVAPESLNVVRSWTAAAASGTLGGEVHEIVLRASDGRDVPAEASVQIIHEDRRPVGIQAIIRDVAERQSLEAQLRQSQKLEAVGRLSGGIAHDFNNLLNIIKGTASLMQGDIPQGSPLQEDAAEIEKAADRAAALTKQLLAFSRKQVLQPKVLDLNDLVAEVVKLLTRTIGEDINLVTSLEAALWKVEADPGQIHQVLMNLAVNARDAMPRGGVLRFETCNVDLTEEEVRRYPYAVSAGAYACLRVRDNGFGMDPATQAQIFEPFFTTKAEGAGTGLGLATVYGIVKQSGGYIWVESETGTGTTFEICLPRAMRLQPDSAVTAAPRVGHGRGETILAVEDDPALRKLFQRVLKGGGYTVLEASNGREALQVAEQHHGTIDLVISDVIMPVMSGAEMAEQFSRRYPGLRVLFTSGYAEEEIGRRGGDSQGLAFLQKPIAPDVLLRKVRDVLDSGSSAGEEHEGSPHTSEPR